MKHIAIILTLLLCASTAWGRMGVMVVGGGVPVGGVTCSGDASSGDNESFEKGAGEFCTADWTETDTDGSINTYSSTQKNCGTYSLAINADSDTAANKNRAYIDLGAQDSDFYYRFYFYVPTIANNYASKAISYVNNSTTPTAVVTSYIILYRDTSSTSLRMRLRSAVSQPTDYFVVNPGNWYRVEVHSVFGGDSTMRLYNSAGTALETSAGGGDYETLISTPSNKPRYVHFSDESSETTAAYHYIDDVKVSLSGGDYIGAATCN